MKSFIAVLSGLIFLIGCQSNSFQSSDLFSKGFSLGKVDKRLEEASGIIASIKNKGMLWSHNDSGNPAEVFLIDTTATIKMICELKGIKNRDWEDITIGRGPIEGKNYLYVGDIGDNASKYDRKFIYRFEEPAFDSTKKVIAEFDTLTIQLSDKKRDTEAMMIDPLTGDLFLISKWEDSVHLYQLTFPFEDSLLTAEKIISLPLHRVVAANISSDGKEILIKDYEHAYYWKRSADESVAGALSKTPVLLDYEKEPQGEAICFANDGNGYYTISETTPHKKAYLMFYRRK